MGKLEMLPNLRGVDRFGVKPTLSEAENEI